MGNLSLSSEGKDFLRYVSHLKEKNHALFSSVKSVSRDFGGEGDVVVCLDGYRHLPEGKASYRYLEPTGSDFCVKEVLLGNVLYTAPMTKEQFDDEKDCGADSTCALDGKILKLMDDIAQKVADSTLDGVHLIQFHSGFWRKDKDGNGLSGMQVMVGPWDIPTGMCEYVKTPFQGLSRRKSFVDGRVEYFALMDEKEMERELEELRKSRKKKRHSPQKKKENLGNVVEM